MKSLVLKESSFKWVFMYYTLLILGSVVGILLLLNGFDKNYGEAGKNGFSNTYQCIISILFGLAGSSIGYYRKFYKDCFEPKKIEISEINSKETLATVFYYLGRPLFSIIFSIVIVFILNAQLMFLIEDRIVVDKNNSLILSSLISCYIGFKTGKFIDIVDERKFLRIEGQNE